MNHEIRYESLFIKINQADTLHLKRIFPEDPGTPILMIHGSIENGRIFYNEKGNGLAPFLARHGFDVYVGDLRGRGLGTPKVSRDSKFGQTEAIVDDIPAFMDKIREVRGPVPVHWVAHSWGGVLLFSALARDPAHQMIVRSVVCFGTKRIVSVNNLHKRLIIDLIWNGVAAVLCQMFGYVPARELKLGSDNETEKFYREVSAWVKPHSPWRGLEDGFDYGEAIRHVKLPPTLHLAGPQDHCLGHPQDVQAFIAETGDRHVTFEMLSRANGNKNDYGHINMLTHPDAVTDHFPRVVDWLRQHDHS